jgi:hypothetical protein
MRLLNSRPTTETVVGAGLAEKVRNGLRSWLQRVLALQPLPIVCSPQA